MRKRGFGFRQFGFELLHALAQERFFGRRFVVVVVPSTHGVVQPVQPGVHALACGGRELEDLDGGVHTSGQLDAARDVELHVRQQVGLVEDHQLRGREHVGVLQRLVLALGHRQDRNLGGFAQVPHGGADQVADVLDEQQAAAFAMVVVIVRMTEPVPVPVPMIVIVVAVAVQLRKRLGHHGRVEVATLAGVDLDRGGAGGADAVGVEAGLLVALDHRDVQAGRVLFQRFDGRAEQRGLARAGAGDQVERGHAVRFEVRPVLLRHAVIGAQDVGLQLDGARLAHARHRHAGRAGAEVQIAIARVHRHHTGFAGLGLNMPGMGRAVVTASAVHRSTVRSEGQLPSRTTEPASPGRRSGPPPAEGERGGSCEAAQGVLPIHHH